MTATPITLAEGVEDTFNQLEKRLFRAKPEGFLMAAWRYGTDKTATVLWVTSQETFDIIVGEARARAYRDLKWYASDSRSENPADYDMIA